MKLLRRALFPLFAVAIATAASFKLGPPEGLLNQTEQLFLGKWSGSRINLKWEIQRFQDRSFELAFEETDLNDPETIYTNYAIGRWWIRDDTYYFEWDQWWGDHGDFSGVVKESIQIATSNRIVTLTPNSDTPENLETRTNQFQLSGWSHKPQHLAIGPDK